MTTSRCHQGFFLFSLTIFLIAACRGPQSLRSQSNLHEIITIDGLERSYILHLPPVTEKGKALPLLIVLHGSYGTGRKMQLGLGFDPYADERGFYVAYPDAYQQPGSRQTARWNDGRDTLASSQMGVDDVKFILSMLDAIAAKVPLDRTRIYVTGASNGGMMTYRLGCEAPQTFAGIAPVIANIPVPIANDCHPAGPISFLAINGDADPFIPIEGGEVCKNVRIGCEKGFVISMADSVKKFAGADSCRTEPQSEILPAQVKDGTHIERLVYPDCSGATQVVGYVVHNGGHTWPPRSGQLPAAGQPTGNLDATATIVNFFFPEDQNSLTP